VKTTIPFRSRLEFGGEILARSATFLPVQPARLPAAGEIFTPEMQHLAGFLPVLNFKQEKFTVAQPLLKGDLR
jgi:hypothetical protein